MSDQYKIAILKEISGHVSPGTPARLSFNSLSKALKLSKTELDALMVELNRQRFIMQYVKKGVDGFTLLLTQKGLDAIQDESFI